MTSKFCQTLEQWIAVKLGNWGRMHLLIYLLFKGYFDFKKIISCQSNYEFPKAKAIKTEDHIKKPDECPLKNHEHGNSFKVLCVIKCS